MNSLLGPCELLVVKINSSKFIMLILFLFFLNNYKIWVVNFHKPITQQTAHISQTHCLYLKIKQKIYFPKCNVHESFITHFSKPRPFDFLFAFYIESLYLCKKKKTQYMKKFQDSQNMHFESIYILIIWPLNLIFF